MDITHHTYGKLNKLNRFIFLFLSIFLIVVGLINFVAWIQALVNNSSSASTFFWYFIGCAIWSPFFFTFASYALSDVLVNDDGLQTKFFFKHLTLGWKDIAEVRPSKPFGLRVGKKGSLLIIKRGLTFFHRIYGLVYGQTNQPALVVWAQISDYDVLMKRISKNRKGKKSSS